MNNEPHGDGNPFTDFLNQNLEAAWAKAKEEWKLDEGDKEVFSIGYQQGAWRAFELMANRQIKRALERLAEERRKKYEEPPPPPE